MALAFLALVLNSWYKVSNLIVDVESDTGQLTSSATR